MNTAAVRPILTLTLTLTLTLKLNPNPNPNPYPHPHPHPHPNPNQGAAYRARYHLVCTTERDSMAWQTSIKEVRT